MKYLIIFSSLKELQKIIPTHSIFVVTFTTLRIKPTKSILCGGVQSWLAGVCLKDKCYSR